LPRDGVGILGEVWRFPSGTAVSAGDAKNPHSGLWGFEASGSSQAAAQKITCG